MKRCDWAEKTALETQYHDQEWGVPVYDDDKIFEMLILEGMQAGLSWSTILAKRENIKNAFSDFDIKIIANYNEDDLEKLFTDTRIIRNKLKIKSVVTNAKCYIEVQQKFGSFSNYIWSFTGNKPIINKWKHIKDVPSQSDLSQKISKDLKKRGFKFVGPVIVYSFLQAIGILNDHLSYCFKSK